MIYRRLILISLVLVLILNYPAPIPEAPQPSPTPEPLPTTVQEAIPFYASRYGVSVDLADCIIKRESGYRAEAVGDGGLAHGAAQFHLTTWRGMRKKMGEDIETNRFNGPESVKTMVWALSEGMGRNWTTYPGCLKVI